MHAYILLIECRHTYVPIVVSYMGNIVTAYISQYSIYESKYHIYRSRFTVCCMQCVCIYMYIKCCIHYVHNIHTPSDCIDLSHDQSHSFWMGTSRQCLLQPLVRALACGRERSEGRLFQKL